MMSAADHEDYVRVVTDIAARPGARTKARDRPVAAAGQVAGELVRAEEGLHGRAGPADRPGRGALEEVSGRRPALVRTVGPTGPTRDRRRVAAMAEWLSQDLREQV